MEPLLLGFVPIVIIVIVQIVSGTIRQQKEFLEEKVSDKIAEILEEHSTRLEYLQRQKKEKEILELSEEIRILKEEIEKLRELKKMNKEQLKGLTFLLEDVMEREKKRNLRVNIAVSTSLYLIGYITARILDIFF